MCGRAVASTMPAGAWAGTATTTGRGRGETTVCSAIVGRAPPAAGRRFHGAPRHRGRRGVTLAAFLLFAITLVAGKWLSLKSYGYFCHRLNFSHFR